MRGSTLPAGTLLIADVYKRQTQQRDYARTHQKIVEIPVEKPVPYEKCEACDRTDYQNAKAKYETQKERLAGQYKAKTVMFQTTLFLLAWYSLTTTLFQAVQSDVLLSCLLYTSPIGRT